MLSCAEQVQIQKCKAHTYKTPRTACVQTIMLKPITPQTSPPPPSTLRKTQSNDFCHAQNLRSIFCERVSKDFSNCFCKYGQTKHTKQIQQTWGRYHGGRRPSSDDSLHSPTVIPPSALDKPSIMKRNHRRRTCGHTSPRRSSTMVTLHDTRFVECRWLNDGWTVKTVVT